MRIFAKLLTVVASIGFLAPFCAAATVTGTVKGPDDSPFEGAFVEAQNASTKITVNVLTDKYGHYHVENLPAGEYTLSIRAIGYKADPRAGIKLTSEQSASFDFALQRGTVRWSDLSGYQGKVLMPTGKGKTLYEQNCTACHMFQTRMAAVQRNEQGWNTAVTFMRTVMHARLGDTVNNQDAAELISYLDSTFGVESKLPKSPVELPNYQSTVRPFNDAANNIVYVEYQLPQPNSMPFSAAPDKNGYLWIPEFGPANRIGRLDPKTGKIEEYTAPNKDTASIHSAIPAPDGSVWLGEQASNKVGHWDPKTQKITEYQDTYTPGKEGLENGGSKHTVRVDHQGRVWGTAVNSSLTVFDPRTKEFTHFKEVLSPYGVEIDKEGNPWFAEFRTGGQIGKVDVKTMKVTKWNPPTPNGWPRRIEIDSEGIVWFAEYRAGKIGRFDPQTQTFKEFQLPGPDPTPYALGIDRNHDIWYSSDTMDVIGRLDPNTGKVQEYPYPHSENMMKEFFMDAQGHMWYGSSSNNVVGYFYLASATEHASN